MNPIDLWNDLATAAGLTLSPQQLEQLDGYLDRLIEKNKVLNLTRITDKADAQIRHIADALTLLPLLPAASAFAKKWPAAHLADVGTGGGVPGAILAIARPDISVTLIDSTKKKLDAVQAICDDLGLTNVRSLHSRIEAVDETFDVVTARAVGELKTLVEWTHGLIKPGGVLLAMKGPKAVEELAAAAKQIRHRRLAADVVDMNLPALPGHVVVRLRRG